MCYSHRALETTKKNAYACSLMYSFIYLIDDEALSIYLLNLYLASFKGKVLNYRLQCYVDMMQYCVSIHFLELL